MYAQHRFGGHWTDTKLELVRKYLQAYTRIFDKNPKARKLHTIYLDAFAGTGYRTTQAQSNDSFLFDLGEGENQTFLKGSARIALEVEPPFKEYIFIERDALYVRELENLRSEFLSRRPCIRVENQEANSFLREWVQRIDWRMTRAVVFLDPYGMQVDWQVIQALGKTKAIDIWLLLPVGMAINRLLTKAGPPPEKWAEALTRIFGTEEWKSAFYSRKKQQTLFGEEEVHSKDTNFDAIGKFFLSRLQTAFVAVAPHPFVLRNSRNNPLYWLCFASGNPKGAPTAVKIAKDILKRS